jgi:predicted DNA-binding transcriptional regulator YafY
MTIDDFYSVAKEAADSLKLLRFDYTKRDGTSNTYLTEPYEIKEGFYWGFKVAHEGGIRKFDISQIERALVVDQIFSPRYPIKII